MAKKNVPIYFSDAYNSTGVSFDTTRKADAIAQSLFKRPMDGIRLVEPHPASINLLKQIHDSEYVDAVRTGNPYELAASAGIGWDEHFFDAVAASTGGVVAAAEAALRDRINSGSLSSGLHHARYDTGNGYCTFNGLVIAARHARKLGAQRVLIIDFDAHCGGGTASLIADMDGVEQIDVSVNLFDTYNKRDNNQLWIVDASTYLGATQLALESVRNPENVDLVLYNAGMDPHERAGGVSGIDAVMLQRREEMVYGWADSLDLPVAFVLAGGYTGSMTMDELVDLHRLTLAAATGEF